MLTHFLQTATSRAFAVFVTLTLHLFLLPHSPAEERAFTASLADSTQAVQANIETLAAEEFAGRRGENSFQAARYIAEQFQELGLQPGFAQNSYFQQLPGPKTESGDPTFVGMNVTAILPGSDPTVAAEWIVVAAHHDHLGQNAEGTFCGADDNASGVAMLLEVARLLAAEPTRSRRPVMFISFDLEEHLLFGSRWWAAHPPVPLEQIKLVIVADMLGRSLGDMPLQSFFLFGAEHGTGVKDLFRQFTPAADLRPIFLSDDFVGTRSDYGPFRDREVPFVFVSTGQSRDYHTIRDTADKINHQQVAAISRYLAHCTHAASNTTAAPAWIKSPPLDLDEVQAVLAIVSQIEQHADTWNLNPLQRLFITQTKRQAQQILKSGTLTPQNRTWLTRSTQLLLFSVF